MEDHTLAGLSAIFGALAAVTASVDLPLGGLVGGLCVLASLGFLVAAAYEPVAALERRKTDRTLIRRIGPTRPWGERRQVQADSTVRRRSTVDYNANHE